MESRGGRKDWNEWKRTRISLGVSNVYEKLKHTCIRQCPMRSKVTIVTKQGQFDKENNSDDLFRCSTVKGCRELRHRS